MNEKNLYELLNEYNQVSDDYQDIYTGNHPELRYAHELSYSELDF
jgi:hypothetical protein